MKKWKARTRIILAAAVVLAATAFVVPDGAAVDSVRAMEWVYSPQAQIRTLNDDCPEGYRCLQLCLTDQNGHTKLADQFQCFPDF